MGKESSEALGKRVSRERGGGTARGIKAHRSPSWHYATFEESSSESSFSWVILSFDSRGKGAQAPLSSNPLLIHKENTVIWIVNQRLVTGEGEHLNRDSQGNFHKAHREVMQPWMDSTQEEVTRGESDC